MVKPQLGHDQVVLELRWSLNTGGHKSRFHCISICRHTQQVPITSTSICRCIHTASPHYQYINMQMYIHSKLVPITSTSDLCDLPSLLRRRRVSLRD